MNFRLLEHGVLSICFVSITSEVMLGHMQCVCVCVFLLDSELS